MTTFGPNALEPCGSGTAKRRHTALAEFCSICRTEGRREPLPSLADLIDVRRRLVRVLQDGAA